MKKVICNFGLFQLEEADGNTFFRSPLLESVMEPLKRKRAQCAEKGRKGGRKPKEKME
ncbi:hypothetical protein H8744_14970 [Oscillospiraceae bacterium N12]|uniref:Uncharacterized protein n=1 Tax=Jilunia laotingensis TaxID=2763675 RepID=A0A926F5S7_9BACT|nr:hypothetical protein [Jilunia laotingensis]MBC8594515.1 hypothetical protein [Jilunia laotingensis]